MTVEEDMSVQTELPKQKAEISPAALYTVVKGKETSDSSFWKEVGDIVSVSATGAGFYLPRECPVGTLISLMVPLPAHLRCYDHDKEFYRVWGLVQHCQELTGEDLTGYHIGVAFIGKNSPSSYKDDPKCSYRICGMNEDGLWKVEEARTPFKTRKHIRYWKSIGLYLGVLDSKKDLVSGERTTTENISKSGAAVFTSLDVNIGDRVKFISKEFDFSGLAVVCNRQTDDDGITRLHLQFVESMFPVDKLDLSQEAEQNRN
jgi:hypothetical protein